MFTLPNMEIFCTRKERARQNKMMIASIKRPAT